MHLLRELRCRDGAHLPELRRRPRAAANAEGDLHFVVISEQGPTWDASQGMREQQYWTEHVTFISGLIDDGTLVLGGPLADDSLVDDDSAPLAAPVGESRLYRALLIVDGQSRDDVRRRLAEDPWIRNGLLTTKSIDRWEVLAGELRQVQDHSPS